jgi:PRTRC genetic system protein E
MRAATTRIRDGGKAAYIKFIGENAALTTPLTVSGTAEELDRDLPATLVNFVSALLELKNTLDRAKAEMDAATNTAQAEARSKSKTPTTKFVQKPAWAKRSKFYEMRVLLKTKVLNSLADLSPPTRHWSPQ